MKNSARAQNSENRNRVELAIIETLPMLMSVSGVKVGILADLQFDCIIG
jgi:hypothetical protein